MALTVEVAGASSDSYATLVEAESYVAWRNSAAWDAATDDTKEGVLKAAVAIIDELHYRDPKSSTTQALRFPTSNTQSSGSYYVPERVKRAQAYLALYLLEDPDLVSGTGNVRQVSVPGGFSVTMAESDLGGMQLPADVMQLLDRYLWKYGQTHREWDSARRGWI